MRYSIGELLSAPHRVIDIVVYTEGIGRYDYIDSFKIERMIKDIPLKENEIQISQDIHNKDWNIVTITATKVEFIKNTY